MRVAARPTATKSYHCRVGRAGEGPARLQPDIAFYKPEDAAEIFSAVLHALHSRAERGLQLAFFVDEE